MTAAWKRMKGYGIVLLASLACCAISAATLDQEACARLKTELMQLELAGARSNMAKGPEWAKVNLASEKLQQIKRLLEIDEQILFRCQGKPLVVLPEGVDQEAAPAERKDGAAGLPGATGKQAPKEVGKAQGKAAPPPNAKAAGAPAAKAPASKAAPAKAASEPPPPAAKPKPKPKPKPKVDDAYKPGAAG
jgi:hypothetical protein